MDRYRRSRGSDSEGVVLPVVRLPTVWLVPVPLNTCGLRLGAEVGRDDVAGDQRRRRSGLGSVHGRGFMAGLGGDAGRRSG